jgi:hypothetical protein
VFGLLLGATGAFLPAEAQMPAAFAEADFRKSGHQPIDGAELAKMLAGNTGYLSFLRATAENPQGSLNVHYWKNTHRVVILITNHDSAKHAVGEYPWWIDGDRYCNRAYYLSPGSFNRSANDMVRCRTLYDLGGVTYVCLDGHCDELLRIVPGNPEKL